jgi:hypothetical protein
MATFIGLIMNSKCQQTLILPHQFVLNIDHSFDLKYKIIRVGKVFP